MTATTTHEDVTSDDRPSDEVTPRPSGAAAAPGGRR